MSKQLTDEPSTNELATKLSTVSIIDDKVIVYFNRNDNPMTPAPKHYKWFIFIGRRTWTMAIVFIRAVANAMKPKQLMNVTILKVAHRLVSTKLIIFST